jgi:hypothetical protein
MAIKKIKSYNEAELIELFQLKRLIKTQTPRMIQWMSVEVPPLTIVEEAIFQEIYDEVVESIQGWSEEDLKMKFITYVLMLGHLNKGAKFITCFEKTISASVQGNLLKTKTDFMVASGILNMPRNPYFHFQEYKPELNPTGEPMAQLVEAMLITQTINNNGKPIYGSEIIGKSWRFVILDKKEYCISPSYDCTQKQDLLSIIAILRKFRFILETELLD